MLNAYGWEYVSGSAFGFGFGAVSGCGCVCGFSFWLERCLLFGAEWGLLGCVFFSLLLSLFYLHILMQIVQN